MEARLGEGESGVVFAVFDRIRAERVALKVLRDASGEAAQRFRGAFERIRDLRHPSLVSFGDLFENDGRLMFTMELVRGTDFRTFAAELDADQLRAAVAQVASALTHLHARGVQAHLKASNVLIDTDGRVVVLDAGLGASGALSADVHALGTMLYESLAGRPYVAGAPTRPSYVRPTIPQDLDALTEMLLARDAVRPSAAEIHAALAAHGDRVSLTPSHPAPVLDDLSQKRETAERLVLEGRIDEGLAVLRTVLEEVGLDGASTPWTALPSIAIESTRLALRGLDFEPRPHAEQPPKLKLRVDACLAAARALSIVDTITASAYQLKALRLALELGDPYRVLFGIALGAGLAAANEGSRGTSANAYLEAAERTVAHVRDPRGRVFVHMARGVVAYGRGQFEDVVTHMRASEAHIGSAAHDAAWELDTSRIFLALGLALRGDLPELEAMLGEHELDAIARGDTYAASHFALVARPWIALVAGETESAREALDTALRAYRFEGYSWASFHGRVHQGLLALAEGDYFRAEDAIRAIDALPGPILLARFRFHRLLARWLKGRTEVTRLVHGADRSARRRLRSIIDGIFEEGEAWADGLAHCLDAAACRLDGDDVLATVALRAARDAFARSGMTLFEAAAGYELATLVGEREDGPALLSWSMAALAARGAAEPSRIAGLLAGIV